MNYLGGAVLILMRMMAKMNTSKAVVQYGAVVNIGAGKCSV